MHENYTLGNCTFQIADIDSQAEKVWVQILGQEPSISMVLDINDSLSCGKLSLVVMKIYAGYGNDLVCLKINSTEQEAPG